MSDEIAYCVKCRRKQKMIHGRTVKMKKNRYAVKGECVKCHTKMNKFIANPSGAAASQTHKARRGRKHNKSSRIK